MITLFEGLAMTDWQILLGVGIIFFIVAAISFISHLRTPKDKNKNEQTHPYQIILWVDIGIILTSIVFYIFR
jgi:heme/copper-type cytochrome/quinol oxidase subunit 2